MTAHDQASPPLLEASKHVRYCLRHLQMLPTPYEAEDCSRMSLAFFALASLDLLGALDTLQDADRKAWTDWIYAQQLPTGGFRGGPFIGLNDSGSWTEYREPPHLVMTYTALLNLAILRDDFTRLDLPSLNAYVRSCQAPDGSFGPFPGSKERDVRFVYCAFVIATLFGTPSADFNAEKAVQYVLSCQSHEGAFGQHPGLEAQGGTTYCALASLSLANALSALPDKAQTLRWLVHRLRTIDETDLSDTQLGIAMLQRATGGFITGFQGRPEKEADTCYGFWISGSIKILDEMDAPPPERASATDCKTALVQPLAIAYLAQDRHGGIAKFPGEYADIYHTCLGLASLALMRAEGLQSLDYRMNGSTASVCHLSTSVKALNAKFR